MSKNNKKNPIGSELHPKIFDVGRLMKYFNINNS